MSQSEVAQLRTKIEEELYAMRQGLAGVSAGASRHQFIQAKMHQIGQMEDQLVTHIGFDRAMLFYCQAYMQIMEKTDAPTNSDP